MGIEEKILSIIKANGPLTAKDIQIELHNHSNYIPNTLNAMRRLNLLTKINDRYAVGREEDVIQKVTDSKPTGLYNFGKSFAVTVAEKCIPLFSLDLSNRVSEFTPEQLQTLYDESLEGLATYLLVANLTGNLRIDSELTEEDRNRAVAFFNTIKQSIIEQETTNIA